MKILYVANARIPTEKANGKQIVKTCEALSRITKLELLIPDKRQVDGISNSDIFHFYNCKNTFAVKRLWCLDFLGKFSSVFTYYLQELTFDLSLIIYLIKTGQRYVYTRSISAALVAKLFSSAAVFYEIHNITQNPLTYKIHNFLWSNLDGIVTISKGLLTDVGDNVKNKTVVPDGVDIEEFQLSEQPKEDLVVYAGSLAERKGIYTLADSAKILGNKIKFLVVGGSLTSDEELKFREYLKAQKISNIEMTGWVETYKVPSYLKKASILLLPDSGKYLVSQKYTSPMKLFEYLACGRPIVASATSANREILNEENAILFTPDDPQDLADKIAWVLKNKTKARIIAQKAKKDSFKYSWDNRAGTIKKFLETK